MEPNKTLLGRKVHSLKALALYSCSFVLLTVMCSGHGTKQISPGSESPHLKGTGTVQLQQSQCPKAFIKRISNIIEPFSEEIPSRLWSKMKTESTGTGVSCAVRNLINKLIGRNLEPITIVAPGGSATAGGGKVGEKQTWGYHLKAYLEMFAGSVKGEKVKLFNSAHGSTNSVYSALLMGSLFPSVPIDLVLGEFRINDYMDSPTFVSSPGPFFELWLRRALRVQGNPIVGYVDIWDDRHGGSLTEDAWRRTTGKKFQDVSPHGNIFSVSLAHYLKANELEPKLFGARSTHPELRDIDNHINVQGHRVLSRLIAYYLGKLVLGVCSAPQRPKCVTDEQILDLVPLPLKHLKNIMESDVQTLYTRLVSREKIESMLVPTWSPKFGARTKSLKWCTASFDSHRNDWRCRNEQVESKVVDGTKKDKIRKDAFAYHPIPICTNERHFRFLVEFSRQFDTFGFFTPYLKGEIQFEWIGGLSVDGQPPVAPKQVHGVKNTGLALTEYHNNFKYFFMHSEHTDEKPSTLDNHFKVLMCMKKALNGAGLSGILAA